MHRDRILLAIDVLTKVEEDHKPFNMDMWYSDDTTKTTDCNTSACAFGWLSRDPRFQALGLRIPSIHNMHIAPPYMAPYSNGGNGYVGGIDASEHLFDITCAQANWLFMATSYTIKDEPMYIVGRNVTPSMVVKRLQRLLELPYEWEPTDDDSIVE